MKPRPLSVSSTIRLGATADIARLEVNSDGNPLLMSAAVVGPTRSHRFNVSLPVGSPDGSPAFHAGLAMEALFVEAAPYLYRLGLEAAGADAYEPTVCLTGPTYSGKGPIAELHYRDEDDGRPICGGWLDKDRSLPADVVAQWSGAANILAALMEGATPCAVCAELQRMGPEVAVVVAPAPIDYTGVPDDIADWLRKHLPGVSPMIVPAVALPSPEDLRASIDHRKGPRPLTDVDAAADQLAELRGSQPGPEEGKPRG